MVVLLAPQLREWRAAEVDVFSDEPSVRSRGPDREDLHFRQVARVGIDGRALDGLDLRGQQCATGHDLSKLPFCDDGAGIDHTRPIAASCGSGVTACVLAFALCLIGKDDAAVYDGSWTEWGGRSDTPIET